MLLNRQSIGVTGHRDVRPDEAEVLRGKIHEFFKSVRKRNPSVPVQLLSALAEGADTIAAEVAIDMGISLVAVLPMSLAQCQKDFESPESLENFQGLLNKAEEVVELPEKPGANLGDQDARSWHYARMGAYISDHSDVLLALWDGKDNNALGGTAQVVRYHLGSDMPGFTDERSHTAQKGDALVYHIVASRDRTGGEPREGLQPGQERWMS